MKKKNVKFNKSNAKLSGDAKCNKVTPKFKGKNYNDFSWYDKNHQLVVDTANLPFNTQLTQTIDILDNGYGLGQPMAMTLGHDWLIGNGTALTTAGRMLWADIRKHNSGATNYGSSDPIMIITAAADIFINIKWMSTFFGIFKYFNARNKLMPEILFKSAGIDYQDFVTNLADYRARFNKLLLQARVITIPKKYPWIDAAMALYSNLFKDEDTDTGREQLYMVNKAAFYVLDSNTDVGYKVRPITLGDIYQAVEHFGYKSYTSSPARWVESGDGAISGSALTSSEDSITFDLYLKVLEFQITKLITDEDANIIQGDMIKAFGDGSAYTTGQIDESFEIKPIYSEEFGWYLHNALIYGSPVNVQGIFETPTTGKVLANTINMKETPATTDITGYNKVISSDPLTNKISVDVSYTQMKALLEHSRVRGFKAVIDTNKYNPGPEDVIWNSRAINKWYGTAHPVYSNGILVNGAVWRVYRYSETDPHVIPPILATQVVNIDSGQSSSLQRAAANMCQAFKWAPLFYLSQLVSGNPFFELVGDQNNIHICADKELEDINDIVMYSLFDIPQR